MIRALLALAIFALFAQTVGAQQITVDDLSDRLHLEHYSVLLDGVQVSSDSAIYLGDDDTLYVSENDLAAWRLKRPSKEAFVRDGLSFYGLQTDLGLAMSFDRKQRQLRIVARASAFEGEPAAGPPSLAAGKGAFLNYALMRESGTYDFNLAGKGGVFSMRYLSTAGADGLEFHRGTTRWISLDPVHHMLLGIGEGTSGDSWLASDAPFAGVHWASDFSSDPRYVGHEPLTVRGIAAAPSQLEVYIDNVLQLRRDVPQGPFTVRNLPQASAYSDIVMILTDPNGKKTTQVARPSVDPIFLGRGKSAFAINAGIGHQNVGLKHSYYRDGVFSTGVRHGLTDTISLEGWAEAIAGQNFADIGADFKLGETHTLQFRTGAGNQRHASKVLYDLTSGKFQFHEEFSISSLRMQPIEGTDFDQVSQLAEGTELAIELSPRWSVSLRLDRSRDNQGSNASLMTAKIRYSVDKFSYDITPFYDFVRRRPSANLAVNLSFDPNHRWTARSAVTTQGQKSVALEYRKEQSDPDDPLSYSMQLSANESQDRNVTISDELPWAAANFNVQQQSGRTLYEPDLSGAIALVGGHTYAVRTISSSESFGIVRVPGLRNVRVTVNDEEAGRTDARGNLLVQKLAPFRDNTISLAAEDLPIGASLPQTQHVFPSGGVPLSLTIPITLRGGGLTLTILDEGGNPLPPGTALASARGKELVGYGGRAYIDGLDPGPQHLDATTASGQCVVHLTVPARAEILPDLGRQVCRPVRGPD